MVETFSSGAHAAIIHQGEGGGVSDYIDSARGIISSASTAIDDQRRINRLE